MIEVIGPWTGDLLEVARYVFSSALEGELDP